MKATNFSRFLCISCAWFSARAEVGKERAEMPTGDDPIKINPPPRSQVPDAKGCLAPPVAPYNVRIQSLSTSVGSVYTRQLVTTADFPCFENSATENITSATHIGDCAEATAQKGMNSFLWEGGACTAFLAWRPRIRADCMDGGTKVVYVVEEPLTFFPGGAMEVSGEIRYDLPRVYLDISYRYDYCGFGEVPQGYKLQWNGTEEVILPKETTAYSLDHKILCFISTDLSLWSIGEDGGVNSNEVRLTIPHADSSWYGLNTGGCIYHSTAVPDYSAALAACSAWGLPSLFSEKVDGEAEAFLDALDALAGLPYSAFFVGLKKNGTDWVWTGGLKQPDVDAAVWASGQPSGPDTCAKVMFESSTWVVSPSKFNRTSPVVCYVSNP